MLGLRLELRRKFSSLFRRHDTIDGFLGFRCCVCHGSRFRVQVHHLRPIALGLEDCTLSEVALYRLGLNAIVGVACGTGP